MTRWMRLAALLLVAVLMMGLVAACGDDDDDDGGTTGTSVTTSGSGSSTPVVLPTTQASPTADGSPTVGTADLVPVTLQLDWYPWGNHAGIYMALANNYFAEEGIDLEVYVPSDPSTALQVVAAGEDELAISYQTDVLLARGQGLEVKSIAALVQHPLNTIMALESSGITEPADLEGTTIGVTGVASDEALLSSVLAEAGLTLDDVELVTVGFELMPALLGESVDAIIGGYWVHESILARNQGQPVTALRIEEWGVPDYYELVVATSDDFAAENPEVLAGFVRALQRGYEDAAKNPDAAVDALVAASPETDEALEREGIRLVIPYWTDDGEVPFGTQTEERWQAYADWLRENDILTEDIDVNDAFTNEFVE